MNGTDNAMANRGATARLRPRLGPGGARIRGRLQQRRQTNPPTVVLCVQYSNLAHSRAPPGGATARGICKTVNGGGVCGRKPANADMCRRKAGAAVPRSRASSAAAPKNSRVRHRQANHFPEPRLPGPPTTAALCQRTPVPLCRLPQCPPLSLL